MQMDLAAWDYAAFVQQLERAVSGLHVPSSSAEHRAANAWLVSLVENASAPQWCVALLESQQRMAVTEAALVVAAGVVAEAAKKATDTGDISTRVLSLLRLCVGVPSRPAAARLANAVASVASASRMEDALLASHDFAVLDSTRQLLLLQAVAEALEEQASPEELFVRPSVRAACSIAVQLLHEALLPSTALPTSPPEAAAPVLRCLASWGACGLCYMHLITAQPALAAALIGALQAPSAFPSTLTGDVEAIVHAALAATVIRNCLMSSMEAGDEVELSACAPLLRALGALACVAAALGAPIVEGESGSIGHGEGGNGGGHGSNVGDCNAQDGASAELVGVAAASAAILLELLIDEFEKPEECSNDALDGNSNGLGLLHGLIELLLACSAHPFATPAENAMEGLLTFLTALPPTRDQAWRPALCNLITERVGVRCACAELRRGTGDMDELTSFREQYCRPLLRACSEELRATWLERLAYTLRPAAERGHFIDIAELEAVEVALFVGSCCSPRVAGSDSNQAAQDVGRLASSLQHAYSACVVSLSINPPPVLIALPQQIASCCEAMQNLKMAAAIL